MNPAIEITPAEAKAEMRKSLDRFAKALNSAPRALRRDECGAWRINGKCGHVYAIPGTLEEPGREGFLLYSGDGSPRAWSFSKRALGFAKLINDGDDEGMLFFDRLPTAAEAEIISDRLGIRKRRDLSEETLAALRERARLFGGSQRKKSPSELCRAVWGHSRPSEPLAARCRPSLRLPPRP
jgi:hypothetical protein